MINPQKDRLIFRDILSVPYEWELEKAVATTYSLDITALVSCMIPLAFSDDVSSNIFKNKIATFTALRNLSKKLVVFSDSSEIKSYNFQKDFSILLENMIVPVNLPQNESRNFPAFHPKMWLLQFRNKNGKHKYRLAILSRNISYDKCYDVCFVLESSDNHLKTKKTKPIIDFLQYLNETIDLQSNPQLVAQKTMIKNLINDLISEKVCFSLQDDNFSNDDFEIFPLFNSDEQKNFSKSLFADKSLLEKEKADYALIVSPFVSERFLDDIAQCVKSKSKTILVTRKQTALSLDEKYNQQFDGYILNDSIVEDSSFEEQDEDDTSEENEFEERNLLRDIHAKMFLIQTKEHTNLYAGSANSTFSAMNKNVELMIRLGCDDKKILSVKKFFNEMNPSETPIFENISFKKEEDSENIAQKEAEKISKIISHINVKAQVFEENGTYRIEIAFSELPEIKGGLQVFLSSLCISDEKQIARKMVFDNIPVAAISEFFILKVLYKAKSDEENDIVIERVIKIPTDNIPFEKREAEIVNKIISDKDSFADYVSLFLSKNPISTQSEILSLKESNAKWKISANQNPLYETLLKASVNNPDAIRYLEADLRLINNHIISDEFKAMYSEFLRAIESK